VRRFRLLFIVIAAALLVPAALLSRRALWSVEIERSARHQSVAERLFDEMERALSGFLSAEEQRPFAHYEREYTPAGEPPGAAARSPLADPPALPFVIGYFQRDPDGSTQLPAERPPPQATAEITRAVSAYWASPAGETLRAGGEAQAPGSTVELDRAARNEPVQQAARDTRKADGPVSAYDALRELNKGVEQRADRQSKVSSEYAAKQSVGQSALADERNERDVAGVGRSNDGANGPEKKWERERFELSPMVGRMVSDRRVLLYRTVVHERQAYHQGLLVDIDKLGAWLGEQALGAGELARYATVSFGPPPAEPAEPSRRIYQHRFAEPFEALSARLVLAPLPGLGGAGYVYALAALSIAVAVLGLAAIYRMVGVAVSYAEQRSNFVAAVTHELKTPITAIRMYAEMLRDGLVPSEAKRDEYHRHITAESERLSRLVDNVLELSRLQNGTRRVRLERGDLGAVCRDVATLVRPHVEGAGFALRLDLEKTLPAVRFDRDALIQVLFNLVDNAVKYANGAGTKEIVLGCRRDADGLRLVVRDRGPGVPTAHLRRIFEPFYRGENELTRRAKGTGIGLALVRGLADEMGARVSGRNVPEGGFEIELAFPAAAAD
jgi:signal transduction histidine kinase